MVVGYRYIIQLHSPYTKPPDGKPRVIFEWFESAQRPRRQCFGRESPRIMLTWMYRLSRGSTMWR